MTKEDALYYEVAGSGWAKYLRIQWMQRLAARYFAWKVNRKWGRYRHSQDMRRIIGIQ